MGQDPYLDLILDSNLNRTMGGKGSKKYLYINFVSENNQSRTKSYFFDLSKSIAKSFYQIDRVICNP
jgi:hypothetical protein